MNRPTHVRSTSEYNEKLAEIVKARKARSMAHMLELLIDAELRRIKRTKG